jgi:cell shape-determining protein MreC
MKKSWSTTKMSSVHVSRNRAIGSALFLLVFCVVLLWSLPRLSSSISGMFWYPSEKVRVWISDSNALLPSLIRDRKDLLNTITTLENIIDSGYLSDATTARLSAENDELRKLLMINPDERVFARVVARPPQLPYDLVMIDKGAADGIVEGVPVFYGKDTVIGIVVSVSEKVSYIRLTSDPGVKISVFILGPNIFTFAEGVGNGVVQVRVPQGIQIKEGDIVLLPAIDSGVIGVIDTIVTSPTDPVRSGYIVFPVNLQSIKFVSVGKSPLPSPDFSEIMSIVNNRVTESLQLPIPTDMLVQPDVVTIEENEQTDEE